MASTAGALTQKARDKVCACGGRGGSHKDPRCAYLGDDITRALPRPSRRRKEGDKE